MQAIHIGTDASALFSRLAARLRRPFSSSTPNAAPSFTNSRYAQPAGRAAAVALLVALSGALLLVTIATAPALFGYHTYNVEGGSPGSSLSTHSVAVTKPTDPADLGPGDVIAYPAGGELYRIVEVSTAGGARTFVLESGETTTGPLTLEGPGDRLVYSVPAAGTLLGFASHPLGQSAIIGAPLALLAAILLRTRSRARERAVEAAAAARSSPRGDDTRRREPERIRLHEMPLLKMVPLATALEMAHRAGKRAPDEGEERTV